MAITVHDAAPLEVVEYISNDLASTSSAFSQLSAFIAHLREAPPNATTGPARKRRKLEAGSHASTHDTDVSTSSESVLAARIILELHKQPSDNAIIEDVADEGPVEVSLESITKDLNGTTEIQVRGPRNPRVGVNLYLPSIGDVIEHLQTAALFSRTKNGKASNRRQAAVFCKTILEPPSTKQPFFRLETEIRWKTRISVVEELGATSQNGRSELKVLDKYFPSPSPETMGNWSVQDFYECVHVPAKDRPTAPQIPQCFSGTKLYPFQERAVDWLLQREGVSFAEAGPGLQNINPDHGLQSASFNPMQDADGNNVYVSHLHGLINTHLETLKDSRHIVSGGILAEEMGLGKTVELIALMCHHKRTESTATIFDSYSGSTVVPSGATLIITPPSILDQWKTEIAVHAPHMKVFHYTGLPPESAPKERHAGATVENLLHYDVILTTYAVLSREVWYAKPPPDRSLRHKKAYNPRKSPLMGISWWRVCLDEAQMVESGVSQAATVARLIPRVNAWAVSGTPLRKDIQDLKGLLTFLRFEPYCSSKALWDRLDKPTFRAIFGQIAMRHTKDKIRDELRLPPQKRVVITVPFTAIEEQNYSEMVRQMCEACGLDEEGTRVTDGRELDDASVIERMREWLVRLRQTCLHAHVGHKNRRALNGRRPLRTVDEVLEVMIDQTDTALKAAVREWIQAKLTRGHIQGNDESNERRSLLAMEAYQQALDDVMQYIRRCRDELTQERARLGNANIADGLAAEGVDEEDPNSDNLGRLTVLRKSLRSLLELEHACRFFIGTCYFQIKSNQALTEPESEEFHRLEKQEAEWYDLAKNIRKEMLQAAQIRAERHMDIIKARKPQLTNIPHIEPLEDLGGIENQKILEMLDGVSELLNAQTSLIEEWRGKIVDILLQPLVDTDDGLETTGDEYEASTKTQDELYVYVMGLRTLVADKSAVLNGLKDVLVDHEMAAAVKLAQSGKGHAPELVLKLQAARSKLMPQPQLGSLKGVVTASRSLVTSLQWQAGEGSGRAKSELAIADRQLAAVVAIASAQAKASTEIDKEQALFLSAMNHRLEYYRQLQEISDTVVPWREKLDSTLDAVALQVQEEKVELSKAKVRAFETKHRYLVNLRQEEAKASDHDCVICRCDFEFGVLTICGHSFCKDCIQTWWRTSKNCPVCKRYLYRSDFHNITYKPQGAVAQEELTQSTPSSPVSSIYSDLSENVMDQIKSIDLSGSSYGSKIDMIARHLLWIRRNDPGAKSIVFSQFGDFLDVLKEALTNWRIGVTSIHNKHGIENFKADPAIECFLLDAKSDASGLNLVNATHVFLAEPMINVALELQAIARVHRIGQQRPTTVYMYLIKDTVEQAIYEISVARRLEHMGKQDSSPSASGSATPVLRENALEAANMLEIQKAPLKKLLRKKGDGEVVPADDLWNCLFSKSRKKVRADLEGEVGRHLRAEAAEGRIAAQAVAN